MTRLILSIVSVLALAAPAAAQPGPGSPGPVVVVRGEGELKVAPDLAFLTLATEHRANTSKEAQAQGAAAMAAVQQKLLGAGIAKDAIRTLSYDLQPQFDFANGRQTPRGFLARNVIEVRSDVPKVGELLELAITAGGTSVQGVRFDVKARQELERKAIALAVADARARAAAAAEGAGGTLGPIVRIEEGGVMSRPVEAPMYRTSAMAADAAPPIVAGETVIRASVTLTVSLK